jgi:hypothetical protein
VWRAAADEYERDGSISCMTAEAACVVDVDEGNGDRASAAALEPIVDEDNDDAANGVENGSDGGADAGDMARRTSLGAGSGGSGR